MWKLIIVSQAIFGLYLLNMVFVNGQLDAFQAGVDYPNYAEIPAGLSFSCQNRLPGYYADIETRCQVWHWCLHSGNLFSFLCPNGTVFNQNYRVCDWFFNVDCPRAEEFYENNNELYKDKDGNPI